MRAIMRALQKEGFLAKRSKQRLDSTHVVGAVASLSALECVRETLRLALEELEGRLAKSERPDFWELFWERYVESKLDYKSGAETLKAKQRQSGVDCLRLLQWLEPLGAQVRDARQIRLLREVFSQQYELDNSEPKPVKLHATGVIQSPHDPEAQWSAKGHGVQKKSWVGYKVQVAESLGRRPILRQPTSLPLL